jgi:predicted GNAT family N-acyltransferase
MTTEIRKRIPELAELLKPLYPYTEHQLRMIINNSVCHYHVENGELVAFGRAITDGVMQTVIYDVIVREGHRKMGRGSAIIRQIMKDCNTPVTILYAEKGSVDFYKKMGFEHFSNGMYRLKQ